MERETGFEPATLALARRCSTTELFPLNHSRSEGWDFTDAGTGLSSNLAGFKQYCVKLNLSFKSMNQVFPEQLMGYTWLGNVHEPENVIERVLILSCRFLVFFFSALSPVCLIALDIGALSDLSTDRVLYRRSPMVWTALQF